MLTRFRSSLTYSNVMATVAVFVALGGSSYAVATGSIDSREIKNNTVRGKDIRNNDVTTRDLRNNSARGADVRDDSLTGDDVLESSLGAVPSASNAEALEGKRAAEFASSSSEPYHEVGTVGQPDFQNSWANISGFSSAAFYKDPLGVVHLKGFITGPTSGTVAFTLPPGYRPPQKLVLPAAGNGPEAALAILDTNGELTPACEGAGSCLVSIDGVTFRAG